MGTSNKFEQLQKVVGGFRSDSAPTTADGDRIALRFNSNSELIVSGGTTSGALAVEGPDAHDAAITGNPVLQGAEAADFDGAALPNSVDLEGDAVRLKASLSGVQYNMLVNENGSATPLAPEGTAAGEGLQISLDDGTDTVFAQGDTTGNLKIVGPAAEDAAVSGNPLLAGGRYDATARDLDDGDVGAIALDADANQIMVGNVAHDAVDLGNPVLNGVHARDTLPTAVAEGDRARVIGDLYGRVRTHSASHDELSVTDNVTVGNGPETQYLGGTLVSVTNGDDDTYYYYIDMSGYRKLGLQLQGISGGSGTCTITIEGTLQDDGTAAASCNYDDISSATFGSANWTADAMLIDDSEKCGCYHFIRVKVVASTGGADDADWTIYYKKLY